MRSMAQEAPKPRVADPKEAGLRGVYGLHGALIPIRPDEIGSSDHSFTFRNVRAISRKDARIGDSSSPR